MEMNQTVQAVSAALNYALLLVRIATKLLVFVVMYHRAVKMMVLPPILLPVSVDLLNVLLVLIAIKLVVLVVQHLYVIL